MSDAVLVVIGIAIVLAYIILLIFCARRKNKKLSTRWLWFYTYIRLPLGMLLALLLLLGSIVQYDGNPLKAIICTGIFLLYLSTYLGLSKREWWGWNLNWLFLILEVLLYPFALAREVPFHNSTEYLIGVGLCAFWWFLPNLIYFQKRKCLFSKRIETPMRQCSICKEDKPAIEIEMIYLGEHICSDCMKKKRDEGNNKNTPNNAQ